MALRELRDRDGIEWTVFAVRPTAANLARPRTRPELAAGWLCFQSDGERRRAPGVPEGWDAMSDGALLALLAAAPPAPRVGRDRQRS